MIQTIRVRTIGGRDLQGENILPEIHRLVDKNSIKKVETAKVYRLEGISKKEARFLAENLLCESINQTYTLNKPVISKVHLEGVKTHLVTIEIAYKPGVMNPEVSSIIKAAQDLGIRLIAADSSHEYGFYGKINREELLKIIIELRLFNPLIEHIKEKETRTLLISGRADKTNIIPIRKMNNEELVTLSKDKLFLNLEEMKVIQNYFKKIHRDPTDCELETLAQTWSEHCAHKTFKAKLIVDGKEKKPLIIRIKEEALKHKKYIVSAFIDNSGVMDFYKGWAINGKVETHNSPSAIEPYGGAMTGSGGVFRDILGTGQGAKTIISTDIFCFASPCMKLSKLPAGCLPPDYLLKKVVAGVRDYGNRMGIPTNNGSVHFHDDFRAKSTVIVGAYGIIQKKKAKKGRPKVGDIIVVVGGRIGRDGIHGATFSSGEMTEQTISINAQAVQIGNAIEEKRMADSILEARDKNLIRAIQDCGAGGFSSAIGEMGEKTGVTIHLERAPLKYQGLAPWEIWLSESQERMILAIPKEKLKKFFEVCKKYNVETTALGKFDGSKKLKVYYRGKPVCNLDMKFLHHGLPQRVMRAKNYRAKVPPSRRWNLVKEPKTEREWIKILKKVLSHGNVCSKEPIVRQYDHGVQGTNALQPFSGEKLDGPNDAVVLQPLLDKKYGMIVSHGLNPVLNNIDPYWGSVWAATEAISNYVSVGGDYKNASLINNYIWPVPDEESLGSLDHSVDAVVDFMKTLKIPVISGKDSLSSTYRASRQAGRGADGTVIKIPPVLCISVFGKISDISKTASTDFKKEGSIVVLVGKMDIDSIGGSTYLDVNGVLDDRIPKVDLKILPKVLTSIHRCIREGKIFSCHDVSEGGLMTAVFEMCLGGNIGIEIQVALRLRRTSGVNILRPDYLLFNETPGCFIVEVESESIARKLFQGVPYVILGKTVRGKNITVLNNKKKLFQVGVEPLKKVWQQPMRRIFA